MSMSFYAKKRVLALFLVLATGLYAHAQFEPTDIGGLELWVSADQGITLNGNYVAQWDDQSGNNRHCTSEFDVIRPTLMDNALNDLPAVSFDGVEDFLQFPEINNVRTVFWVLRENPSATGSPPRPLLGWSGGLTYLRGANEEFWDASFSDPAVHNGQTRLNFEDINGGTTVVPTSFSIVSLVTTAPLNASHFTMELNIFGRTWWGEMAEVLIYSAPLSPIEIDSVENYLATKYSPPFAAIDDVNVEYGFCDTTLCAPPGFSNYIWNNNVNDPCMDALAEGSYTLEMTDAFGRVLRDTVEVSFPGQLNIPDSQLCAGDVFLWNTGLSADDYVFEWSNETALSTIALTEEGDYSITVTDTNNCSVTENFHLDVDAFPGEATLGNNLSLCAGNQIGLTEEYTNLEYLWSTDETTPTITVSATGDYWIEATNENGCTAYDTIHIIITGIAPEIGMTATGKCEEGTTQFSGINISGSDITSWEWNFGDEQTASGQNVSHTYAEAGDKTVTLTATETGGCFNTLSEVIHIYSAPQLQYITGTTCDNAPITFTDNSQSEEGTITTWNWLIDGIFYSGSIVTASLDDPGLQNILLEVTTEYGCTAEVSQAVNVLASPVAGFNTDSTCEGELTLFSEEVDASQSGPILEYDWNFGDNTGSSLSDPSHFYSSGGSFDVSLKVEAANGCRDTLSQAIVIHALPEADFLVSNACLEQLYTLQSTSNSNDSITAWFWTVNGTNYTEENPEVIFTTTGLQPVTLSVTTSFGCTSEVQQQIPVWSLPTAAYSFEPEIGAAPFEVQFINESTGATDYHWIFGDTYESDDINPVHIFTLTGTSYTRLIAINNAGCADTTGQIITIADPTLDIMVESVICTETTFGQQVTAKLINTGNITIHTLMMSYQVGNDAPVVEIWNGDLPRSTSVNFTFQSYLQVAGQQFPYVCVTAETSPMEEHIETNLTDNQYCKPLEEVGLELFPPYPNPGDDRMFIRFITPLSGDLQLHVFDVKGSQVMEITDEEVPQGFHQYFLDISALAEGHYKLELMMNDKRSVVSFMKVHKK